MKTAWAGDPDLVGAVERTFRSASVAAVAVVTPEREMTAMVGADPQSTFEIGSISKALTGMLYRDAVERGLVSPTTVLRELLPLDGHEVGSVSLSSLAIHRSGLPGLPPGMHPVRRTVNFWVRGENPYGDSLSELLDQTRTVRLGAPRPRYSNLGFQLFGHAVAAAAGSTYRRLLQDVLGPGFATPARAEDLGPTDLTGANRFGRPVPAWVGEALAPAGGVRATIGTMRDLLRSILNGTARGLSALDPVSTYTPRVGIGAGWITVDYRGRPITWHNGSTGGFGSWMGFDRAAGTGVVVLAAVHGPVDRQGFQLLSEFATPGTVPPSLTAIGGPAA